MREERLVLGPLDYFVVMGTLTQKWRVRVGYIIGERFLASVRIRGVDFRRRSKTS